MDGGAEGVRGVAVQGVQYLGLHLADRVTVQHSTLRFLPVLPDHRHRLLKRDIMGLLSVRGVC